MHPASPVRGQQRFEGSWQGYWLRAGDTMFVTLDVKRDAAGRYTATFAADRLRVSGIPFSEVQLRGCCDVTLTLRGDATTAIFTGRIDGDSLTGAFQECTGDGRFAFTCRVDGSNGRRTRHHVYQWQCQAAGNTAPAASGQRPSCRRLSARLGCGGPLGFTLPCDANGESVSPR